MEILTVTARGQITLPKRILQHLGIKPGNRIQLDMLPGGRLELKAYQSTKSIRRLHGLLVGKTNGTRLSVEEINQAISEAGAVAGIGDTERK